MLNLRSFRTALEPSLLGGGEKRGTSAKAAVCPYEEGQSLLGDETAKPPAAPQASGRGRAPAERLRSRAGLRLPGPLTSPTHGRHGDGPSARARQSRQSLGNCPISRSPSVPALGRASLWASKGRQ